MGLVRDAARLREALGALGGRVAGPEADWRLRQPSVSSWSVAQQVDHTLRAARSMLAAAGSLAPEGAASAEARAARARLNMPGRMVLWLGRIPRGRGRAPPEVLPGDDPTREASGALLVEVRTRLEALVPRLQDLAHWPGALPHPALGRFAARHWMRFARIHTRHHLALVDDILRSRG